MSMPSSRSVVLASVLGLLLGCSHAEPAPEKPASESSGAASPAADAGTSTPAQSATSASDSTQSTGPLGAALPPEPPPLLQLPEDVHPLHYALDLVVDPDASGFTGREDIQLRLDKPRQLIWLHGLDLDVTEVSLRSGGQTVPASWKQVDRTGVAQVSLARPVGPGEVTLHFAWKRAWNENTLGLYRSKEDGRWYATSQFESIYARRAFPSFDEPRFKTPFDVTLEVPHADVAVGNGKELSREPIADGKDRVRFETTPKLPTYLVLFAVGPFDVVEGPTLAPNALRNHPLPTRGLAPKGRGPELAFGLKAAAEMLAQEEQYFGIGFPYSKLDHIAVPDFEAGAMENAGAITYREQALLYKPGITPPMVREHIAVDIAHEMAHQWFGDLVTMPWWTDTWLNESFATWMESRVVSRWDPSVGAVREDFVGGWLNGAMHEDALASARAIRQPLTSTDAIQDQFDGITYAKGAAVLAMFERWVGEEKFRQGIHDYLTAHAFGSGSTDDLLRSLSEAAGRDVVTPFHSFLDQPGIPLVSARLVCAGRHASLALSQSRFAPVGSTVKTQGLWQIPVCARYGKHGKVRESCTLLTHTSGTLPLEGGCPRWVFPNAEASGYYRWSLDAPTLAKLSGRALQKLAPIERISFARNLGAAVSADAISFADALKALAPLAHEEDPKTVTSAMGLIETARERLVPSALKPNVDRYGRALYRPVWKQLGWSPKADEPVTRRELRSRVLGFLTLDVRDPALRAEAEKKGLAYAGLQDGKFHPEAVAPELAQTALSVAVQEKGAPLFDALEKRLGSLDDGVLRGQVLRALSGVRDPALSARVLALTLDPRLRTNERWIPVGGQLSDPATRARAWTWVKQSLPEFLPLLSTGSRRQAPRLGSAFCDAAKAEEVKAFFSAHAAELPGAERPLAQTLEGIHLCVAAKAAHAASARAFFTGR